jgi:hypothetical protein
LLQGLPGGLPVVVDLVPLHAGRRPESQIAFVGEGHPGGYRGAHRGGVTAVANKTGACLRAARGSLDLMRPSGSPPAKKDRTVTWV